MKLRQRILGLAALIVLAGIVVGLPLLLLALGGNPLPTSLPGPEEIRTSLLTQDDGTLALAGAKLLGWLVWAGLTASILVEAASALRGVRAPALPVLALPQSGMRPLVVAAVALFITAPGGTVPASAAPTPVAATAPVPTTVAAPTAETPKTTLTASTAAPQTSPTPDQDATRPYEVRPGDTLWSIAEAHLGSGHDYHRIVDLNRDHLSGGADWVTPGMVLQVPGTRDTGSSGEQDEQEVVVETGDTLSALAAEHLGEADRWPEIYEASTGTVQPDGRRLQDPDLIYPGWRLDLPEAETHEQHPGTLTDLARSAAEAGSALGAQPETPAPTTAQTPQQPAETVSAGDQAARSGLALGAAAGAASITRDTAPPASQAGGEVSVDETSAAETEEDPAPAWLLEGIVGSGALLGGALFTALALRRRSRFRARRPGRALASTDPVLAPVEKTIQTHGRAAALTLDQLDQALRRLGGACTAAGETVPAVAAVQLASHGMWLHLSEPARLAAPWKDSSGDGQHWFLPAGTAVEAIGPLEQDAPAPYPLLVSIGAGDDGSAWLLNLEDLEVILTGPGEYVDDLARYLAAEVAVNPWSAGVRLDCVGVASEVALMNPARVRVAEADAVEDLVAEVVGVIDRVGTGDVPTARARQSGEDTWPARLVLLSAEGAAPSAATDQLRQLLAQHPGSTGASVVLRGGTPTDTAVHVEATGDGRIRIPAAGLDLVGVGLTADEAAGCAALLAQSHAEPDVPMPAPAGDVEGADVSWRGWTDHAGAIRPEHTAGRESTESETVSLLPEDDEVYEAETATTAQDLTTLAPHLERDVAQQVLETDPTLDADLAAWWDSEARVARLTLIGPVRAKTWGKPLAERKAYMTELLAYLALHPQGVITSQAAEAFGITEARTRDYIGRCRDWLGTDPATGTLHIPHAQDTPATRSRGVNVYQVLGLLVDVDLFRRLRARAAARGGAEGIADLKAALRLVQGRPFDQLRRGGWGWLFEGDRLDQHMVCAVVDVAHLVATHDLHTGDLAGARAAAEIALLAAPHEEVATLDLAAATAREGNTTAAVRILQTDVCNRTDDPDLPPGDLPERTQQIFDRHGWLDDRKEAV